MLRQSEKERCVAEGVGWGGSNRVNLLHAIHSPDIGKTFRG
jgi:hypothetical protein